MTPELVGLVLLAALLHASWNAMAKSGGTPQYSTASYRLVGAFICLPFLFVVPIPLSASWSMILLSVLLQNIYYATLSKSYHVGDLSQMYPLFRGLAPVLVALGAGVFAGEWLSPGGMFGICIISIGLSSLTFLGSRFGRMSPVALRWGLATSVLIAAYTVTDGIGVRAAGNSLSYILWLFVLEPIPICLVLASRDASAWVGYMRQKPAKIVMGGVAVATAYALVIYAMGQGSIAMVSSLRETSVIFAALIGALLFREPFGRQRILAAVLVAGGIVLIRSFA